MGPGAADAADATVPAAVAALLVMSDAVVTAMAATVAVAAAAVAAAAVAVQVMVRRMLVLRAAFAPAAGRSHGDAWMHLQ